MAEVIWTNPALSDMDRIADYIALDDVAAARRLVQRVFEHVAQLATHPTSGSRPPELKGRRYRQIVEPPCGVFYRVDGPRIHPARHAVRAAAPAHATPVVTPSRPLAPRSLGRAINGRFR